MKAIKPLSTSALQEKIDQFNRKYRVGDPVKVKLDSGEIKETTVRNEATILGGHTAVGWFSGIFGCYDLNAVIE
jgi:hypothetical protein